VAVTSDKGQKKTLAGLKPLESPAEKNKQKYWAKKKGRGKTYIATNQVLCEKPEGGINTLTEKEKTNKKKKNGRTFEEGGSKGGFQDPQQTRKNKGGSNHLPNADSLGMRRPTGKQGNEI